ncbi:hypothetical protein NX801_25680 [Streptomyces sp. LP05-1]|uniref:Secreted protein n=1 Tax=Streptomyces pyxinae TaxID=2970734 RepID=A0ABT2CNZ6_9ACTN|nr:hypothetical protein [Streptomyces sp. LP05-1]MCS0638976.1 hypothetical protein [Streptomyces sp. LP05-1]
MRLLTPGRAVAAALCAAALSLGTAGAAVAAAHQPPPRDGSEITRAPQLADTPQQDSVAQARADLQKAIDALVAAAKQGDATATAPQLQSELSDLVEAILAGVGDLTGLEVIDLLDAETDPATTPAPAGQTLAAQPSGQTGTFPGPVPVPQIPAAPQPGEIPRTPQIPGTTTGTTPAASGKQTTATGPQTHTTGTQPQAAGTAQTPAAAPAAPVTPAAQANSAEAKAVEAAIISRLPIDLVQVLQQQTH